MLGVKSSDLVRIGGKNVILDYGHFTFTFIDAIA